MNLKETPEQIQHARKIMAFKDFVPFPLRFALFVLFIILYQSSGTVYMGAVLQMAGDRAWLNEDVLIAGYAGLIGMIMFFPLMVRFTFAFDARDVLIWSTIILMAGTLICMYCTFLPIVVLVSFLCGFVRMTVTNYCILSIQLNISPTRDLAYFYPFLYSIIQVCIQMNMIISGYSVYWYNWETANWITIGVFAILLFIILITIRRHYRAGPYIPFWGIDYTGIILWSSFLFGVVFIATYGEYYDWWNNDKIWTATWLTIIALILSVWRASHIRHPFIDLKVFVQPKIWPIMGVYFIYSLMVSTTTNVQNILTMDILGFDMYHATTVNWAAVIGVLCATCLSYFCLVKWKFRAKTMVMVGFAAFTLSMMMTYDLVGLDTEKFMLYPPMFLRGFAMGMLYVNITYILGTNIKFQYWFMSLCVLGFIRTAVAQPMCEAVLVRLMKVFKKESLMQLSSEMDLTSPAVRHFGQIYGDLQMQSLMVGMKEVFGVVAFIGVLTIIVIYSSKYRGRLKAVLPRTAQMWILTKKEVVQK